jgi:hypothetical protein
MLAGGSAAAIDWVAAQLLGYDPDRIPIARQAFAAFRWPIVSFDPSDVLLVGDLGSGRADELLGSRAMPHAVTYPVGWRDAARASGRPSPATGAWTAAVSGVRPQR